MNNELHALVRTARVAVIVLTVFLVAAALVMFQRVRYPVPSSGTITVTGEGEVFAIPDVATFTYTVAAQGSDVASAQTKATETYNQTKTYLEKAGIKTTDIKTINYSVQPVYTPTDGYFPNRPESEIVAEEVRHLVEVKVRDNAQAGEILAGLGELGISEVSGLSFTIDDDSELANEAIQKAITDARMNAKKTAGSLGVRLGKITSFYVSDYNQYYPMYEMKAADGLMAANEAAPELTPGEQKIQKQVEITFEIR